MRTHARGVRAWRSTITASLPLRAAAQRFPTAQVRLAEARRALRRVVSPTRTRLSKHVEIGGAPQVVRGHACHTGRAAQIAYVYQSLTALATGLMRLGIETDLSAALDQAIRTAKLPASPGQ